MPSATDFLPACITEFMNFVTTTFPNFGSGRISRFSALWRRDISRLHSLRSLGAVLRTALLAVLHALGIEHAAQDVVAHAGQVLHATAADHHHRVLLQVMALAGDVADDFEAVGQTNLGDLTQSRVRLLRRRRVDARADAALLRALLQSRHFLLRVLRHPRFANELIDRRHRAPEPSVSKLFAPVVCRACAPIARSLSRKRNRAIRSSMSGRRWKTAEDRDALTAVLRSAI